MFEIISRILLFVLLILQIITMLYLIISTIKRDKEDKKFWKELHEKEIRFYEDLQSTVSCQPEGLEESKRNE